MKALIIADNQRVIEKIQETLETNGYDTIIYRWLLKALDNFVEISPDVMVISAFDYPRHWKTMAQFAKSGIIHKNPKLVLYRPENTSQEEIDKEEALGITGFFTNIDEDGFAKLISLLDISKKQLILEDESVEEIPTVCDLIGKDFVEKNNGAFEGISAFLESLNFPSVDNLFIENDQTTFIPTVDNLFADGNVVIEPSVCSQSNDEITVPTVDNIIEESDSEVPSVDNLIEEPDSEVPSVDDLCEDLNAVVEQCGNDLQSDEITVPSVDNLIEESDSEVPSVDDLCEDLNAVVEQCGNHLQNDEIAVPSVDNLIEEQNCEIPAVGDFIEAIVETSSSDNIESLMPAEAEYEVPCSAEGAIPTVDNLFIDSDKKAVIPTVDVLFTALMDSERFDYKLPTVDSLLEGTVLLPSVDTLFDEPLPPRKHSLLARCQELYGEK